PPRSDLSGPRHLPLRHHRRQHRPRLRPRPPVLALERFQLEVEIKARNPSPTGRGVSCCWIGSCIPHAERLHCIQVSRLPPKIGRTWHEPSTRCAPPVGEAAIPPRGDETSASDSIPQGPRGQGTRCLGGGSNRSVLAILIPKARFGLYRAR